MKTTSFALVLLPSVVAFGCSSNPSQSVADGGASDSSTADGGSPDSAAANGLGFIPSNLPADFTLDEKNDIVLSGKNCGIAAGDAPAALCVGLQPYSTRFVKQPDGSTIKVVSMKTLTIDATAEMYVDGSYPIVLVAEKVTIQGHVIVGRDSFTDTGAAGGGDGNVAAYHDGTGPGAGKKGDETAHIGGGGGGYCGKGAPGSASGANGGGTYGTPEIVPLVGGSGAGSGYDRSGAGGGALEIVARDSIEIASSAVVNAGGREGNRGSGGGSGGSILLEAPTVTIAGALIVNGGGGGANGAEGHPGERAHDDGSVAKGGVDTTNPTNNGGNGSGAQADGLPGAYDGDPGAAFPKTGGGGGGGAGRIRVNTRQGGSAVTGVVAPAFGGACATQGTLR
jgi:hypothetical protein